MKEKDIKRLLSDEMKDALIKAFTNKDLSEYFTLNEENKQYEFRLSLNQDICLDKVNSVIKSKENLKNNERDSN